MPAQTTFGVPYPLPTDPVSAGASDVQGVAEALDSRVLAGRLDWGPAGAAADTGLYRAAPGQLKTDGMLLAGSQIFANLGTSQQIGLNVSGVLVFGSAADTSLYRLGAGALKTDGTLVSGLDVAARHTAASEMQLGAKGPSGEPGVGFGPAADATLFRRAANILRTPGRLEVGQLGLANVEAPQAPGVPVGRFVVYDEADNALGFVYIYAS